MRHAMCDYCITLITQFPSLAQLSKGRVQSKTCYNTFLLFKVFISRFFIRLPFSAVLWGRVSCPTLHTDSLVRLWFSFAKNKDFLPNRLYRRELLALVIQQNEQFIARVIVWITNRRLYKQLKTWKSLWNSVALGCSIQKQRNWFLVGKSLSLCKDFLFLKKVEHKTVIAESTCSILWFSMASLARFFKQIFCTVK